MEFLKKKKCIKTKYFERSLAKLILVFFWRDRVDYSLFVIFKTKQTYLVFISFVKISGDMSRFRAFSAGLNLFRKANSIVSFCKNELYEIKYWKHTNIICIS